MSLFLDRASRNARVIAWLRKQPIETLDNIRMLYSGSIGCDLEETFPLDSSDEDEALDDETLQWIYAYFANQIDRAA